MTDSSLASIAVKIDEKTMAATVERVVLQEIAARLGDPGVYFERVVKSCVEMTVDAQGNPSRSGYDKTTLIEFTARKAVQGFAIEVVKKWLDSNRVTLEAAIAKALQKNVGTMAKTIADVACSNVGWGTVQIGLSTVEKR